MDRDSLLARLARYQALDESEKHDRAQIEAFVRQHPRCFESAYPAGHLTGSAWLVDADGDRVLLTHHRKLGRWIQLGGHADGESDLLAVALREAREESGLTAIEPVHGDIFDLGVHHSAGHDGLDAHLHYDIRFAFRTLCDGRFTVSDESHALAWFTLEELSALDLDEAVRRMSEKWWKGRRRS